MNDADLQAVRQLVLGAFRWVDGHADLSRVFHSADVLAWLVPRWPRRLLKPR